MWYPKQVYKSLYYGGQKVRLGFSTCSILWKKLNEFFGQPSMRHPAGLKWEAFVLDWILVSLWHQLALHQPQTLPRRQGRANRKTQRSSQPSGTALLSCFWGLPIFRKACPSSERLARLLNQSVWGGGLPPAFLLCHPQAFMDLLRHSGSQNMGTDSSTVKGVSTGQELTWHFFSN